MTDGQPLDDHSAPASYLQDLTLSLAIGASGLDAQTRQRHANWLIAQQRPDGGFAGREGESDPYYTAFALRALWILDGGARQNPPCGVRCDIFLQSGGLELPPTSNFDLPCFSTFSNIATRLCNKLIATRNSLFIN